MIITNKNCICNRKILVKKPKPKKIENFMKKVVDFFILVWYYYQALERERQGP